MRSIGIAGCCLFFTIMFGAGAMSAMPAAAQTFDEGMKAYQAEDFATALKIFRTLADQGHAAAQVNLGIMYANGEGGNRMTPRQSGGSAMRLTGALPPRKSLSP